MTKRISLFLSVVGFSLLIAACTTQPPTANEQMNSSSSLDMMQASSDSSMDGTVSSGAMTSDSSMSGQAMSADSSADGSLGVSASVGVDVSQGRVITITTSTSAFTPNTITVKKGEKITLHLVGGQGNHGFGIPDLGINTAVPEGKTVDIDLPTDKAGTFNFLCTIPCGPGHSGMNGTITIQ